MEDSPQQEVFDVPSTSTSGSSQLDPENYLQVELVQYDDDPGIQGIYALQLAQNQGASGQHSGQHFMAAAGPSRPPPVTNLNLRPPPGGYKPGHKQPKLTEQESDLILDLEPQDLRLIGNAFGSPPPDDLLRAANDLYLNGRIPGIDK